jgi:hypothetical protein
VSEGKNGGEPREEFPVFGRFGSHGQSEVHPPSELETSNSLSNGATPNWMVNSKELLMMVILPLIEASAVMDLKALS